MDQVNISNPEQLKQPDFAHIMALNSHSTLCPRWRELQYVDHASWSRRYLLPLIKITCLSLGWTILTVKRLIPIQLGSESLLNRLSCFFMKYCASPEAQSMLYRHFSVESALVHFIVQNNAVEDRELPILKPTCPEQLGDIAGTNATLLHDSIILNLFKGLNRASKPLQKAKPEVQELDFSALDQPDFKIYRKNRGRLCNLDFESCLYITVLVLTLCFTPKQIENAVGSMFLDNSLMSCLANLTGDNAFSQWTVFSPGEPLHIPLNPARYLYRHILVHEHAYNQLQQLVPQRK